MVCDEYDTASYHRAGSEHRGSLFYHFETRHDVVALHARVPVPSGGRLKKREQLKGTCCASLKIGCPKTGSTKKVTQSEGLREKEWKEEKRHPRDLDDSKSSKIIIEKKPIRNLRAFFAVNLSDASNPRPGRCSAGQKF